MQQTERKTPERNNETPYSKYTARDIMIKPDAKKYQFDENFITNSNANWKKQFEKYDIPKTSEIIPSWFYLGNKVDASDKTLLKHLGITHILNVSDTLPCYFPNDFIYAQIKVDDTPAYNLQPYFSAATEFIDEINPRYNKMNRDQHLKLFVHCAVGKSRSATIVIQYLIGRGIDFNNRAWLQNIERFGLIDNFIYDDRLYRRSLQCFNLQNILCCSCCIRCLRCCWCCQCCGESNVSFSANGSDDDDDKQLISEEDKYKEWKAVSDVGTMSYRNSCDYVQKCRVIICPNQSFATQLAEYEESVRNNLSTYKLCYAWKHNYGFAPKRCYEYSNDKNSGLSLT